MALARSTSLQQLSMSNCTQASISHAAFVALAQSPSLRKLDIGRDVGRNIVVIDAIRRALTALTALGINLDESSLFERINK